MKGKLHIFTKIIQCSVFLSMLSLSLPSHAQTVKDTIEEWKILTFVQEGKTICYMTESPHDKKGNYTKRGNPHVMITQANNVDEVSLYAGYAFKDNSKVTVDIDNTKFYFYTHNEQAWAVDAEADRKIIQAMKNGKEMIVSGTSKKGTHSIDSYALKGFTKAHQKMKEHCKQK